MSPIDGLRCTLCRSPDLEFAADVIICRSCGQECPVLDGVPVMFEAVSVRAGAAVDEAAAREILVAFDLQEDPLSLLQVRRLMRRQVCFGGSLIQVESKQFLDRVRNTGMGLGTDASPSDASREEASGADLATAPADAASPPSADLMRIPRYGWVKNYMPRRVKAGAELLANMRLENHGEATMRRAGNGRTMIAARWQHRDGTEATAPDVRTPLLIDLAPGQAVTVAVRLVAPTARGSYLLTLTLVQEQVRWLDTDAITMVVAVEHDVPGPIPAGWTMLEQAPADYDSDHRVGRDMLASWLSQHLPPRSSERPRVLEVGGNVFPTCAALDVELTNIDVDLLGLQIGRMIAKRRGQTMTLICADAFNLPFAAGYFDAIVIFASLHHFPDPAALLEQLRRKLRPGGFIGLFCEPVGHIWPGAVLKPFLDELERGVNEQSFSLREYELMFRQADLAAVEVVVDLNSLKARLVHGPADEAATPSITRGMTDPSSGPRQLSS